MKNEEIEKSAAVFQDVNESPNQDLANVPPQYRDLPADVVEELLSAEPTYIDKGFDDKARAEQKSWVDALRGEELRVAKQENNSLSQRLDTFGKSGSNIKAAQEKVVSEFIAPLLASGSPLAEVPGLSAHELNVLTKMSEVYKTAKAEKPDEPVQFQFSQPADQLVYDNLIAKRALAGIKNERVNNDQVAKERVIAEVAALAGREVATSPKKAEKVPQSVLGIPERKKLDDWRASYELAKVAKQKGVDLTKLSREEYAQFAIDEALAIGDNQLRAAPRQRMATSAEEIVEGNRRVRASIRPETDLAFEEFFKNIKAKAGQADRYVRGGIKVRSGTKDSQSWLFFGINNSILPNQNETYKSYISIKDLNSLTPDRFVAFMESLRDSGYNGDIKTFQDLPAQGVNLNDQIVMHGASQADAALALRVAENFFGADLDQKSMGKDEVIDGKNMSYSEVLARKIRAGVDAK